MFCRNMVPGSPAALLFLHTHLKAAQVMVGGRQAGILLGAQARQPLTPPRLHCACTAPLRCIASVSLLQPRWPLRHADPRAHLNAAQVATEGRQAG